MNNKTHLINVAKIAEVILEEILLANLRDRLDLLGNLYVGVYD